MYGKRSFNALFILCGIIYQLPSSNGQTSSRITCADSPCQHDGHCMHYGGHYFCICHHGYEGGQCQININECASVPCQNRGTCVDQVNSYECVCPTGYAGVNCQIPTCPYTKIVTSNGEVVSWPETMANTEAESIQRCDIGSDKEPYGEPIAARFCALDEDSGTAAWKQPDVTPCVLEKYIEYVTNYPKPTTKQHMKVISTQFMDDFSTSALWSTFSDADIKHANSFKDLRNGSSSTDIIRIGFGLSTVILCAIVVTAGFLRCVRIIAESTTSLLYVIVSLIFLHCTIAIGTIHFHHRCTLVAVIIHYFILATLSWMTVEVYDIRRYMHKNTMEDSTNKRVTWFLQRHGFAWGLPFAIVAVSLLLGYDSYIVDNKEICFINKGYVLYFGLLVPAGSIILYVTVCQFYIVYQLKHPGVEATLCTQNDIKLVKRRLQNAVTTTSCTAIMWVTACVAFLNPKQEFQIIFCFVSVAQGLILIWILCLRHNKILACVKRNVKPIQCCRRSTAVSGFYQFTSADSSHDLKDDKDLVFTVSYRVDTSSGTPHHVVFNI